MSNMDVRGIIEKIQDDLVYVIEELLFDRIGEASSELNEVLQRLEAQQAWLGEGFVLRLQRQLAVALDRMSVSDRFGAASALVDIRRGLRNCQLELVGKPLTYPYGMELGRPGEVVAMH